MNRRTAGFTMLEMLVVTAIVALVANGVLVSVFQILRNSESSENKITAVTEVQNTGYWVSLDARKAQEVNAQAIEEGRVVTLSWDERTEGAIDSTDGLYYAYSSDGGNNWSSDYQAFMGWDLPSTFSTTIPAQYLTSDFRLRFYLVYFGSSDEYLYLDDITYSEAIFSDNCSSLDGWDNGSRWIPSSGEFRGQGGGDTAVSTVTMTSSLDLDAYQGQTVRVYWHGRESGSESGDWLNYAFSGNGGTDWSQNYQSFNGDTGSTGQTFSYTVPAQYVTGQFKMRFYWQANYSNDYVYLDDIMVAVPLYTEDCSDFSGWDDGDDWSVYSSDEFRGHHAGGSDDERYLTMDTSLDLTSSQFAGGFPLVFTWTTWSGSGGTGHEVTYTITNGELMRSHSINGGAPVETLIAKNIDPANTSCSYRNGEFTLTITSAVGGGPSEGREIRQYKVLTRPD